MPRIDMFGSIRPSRGRSNTTATRATDTAPATDSNHDGPVARLGLELDRGGNR